MASGGQYSPLLAFYEAVKCERCKRSPRTPKTLQPCLHTFCGDCLAEHVATLQGRSPLTCPVPNCGVEQATPLDDPANVEINVCFENLLRHAEREIERSANPTGGRCDRCRRTKIPVEKFCKVCRKSLCNSCVEDHRAVPETEDHDLVANTGQHGRWLCCKHAEGEEPCQTTVRLYCERCKVVMCMICRVTDHTGHEPTCTAAHAYENPEHRVEIEKQSVAAKEIESQFETTIGELENLKLRLLESKKNTDSAIDRKVTQLHEALEEEKRRVKREAKEIFDNKTEKCAQQMQKMAEIYEKFRHSRNVTQRTLEIGEAEDVLYMEGILINGLKKLSEMYNNYDHKLCEDDVIQFAENARANVQGLVGYVTKDLFIPGFEDRLVDSHFYAHNL